MLNAFMLDPVMAGLVPAIHAFLLAKTWMPATSAGMTHEVGQA